ncbi:MAG: TonB-dependent receptor [Massilia sp.]|nr:TonB-dependent receptor [Massilia sp.]
MRLSWLSVIAVGAILSSATPASAADDVSAAKLHYERGTTLYDLQRYLEAAKEYEAAFEAKNDPALLFNIGQAYRFGGDYIRAITAFRSYLRRLPDASNRSEVEQRITELQRLADEQKRNQQAPPSGTLPPGQAPVASPEARQVPPPEVAPVSPPPTAMVDAAAQRSGRTKLIAGIATAAVGVAVLAVGATFEGLASSQNNALSHPTQGEVFDPSKEQALKTYQTAGPILLGIGGAAVVAGTVIAIIGARQRSRSAHVVASPAFSTSHVGVVINGAF